MGFKTISLSDHVYRRLRGEKRPGESFSEVLAEIPLVTSDEHFRRPADFGLLVRAS